MSLRILFLLSALWLGAAPRPGLAAAPSPAPATLSFDGNALLTLRAPILSFSPADRVAAITAKLHKLASDPLFDPNTMKSTEGDGSIQILAGDQVLMSVTDADAKAEGLKPDELAAKDLALLRRTLSESRLKYGPRTLLKGVLETLAYTLGLVGLLAILQWVHGKARTAVQGSRNLLAPRWGLQRLQILSPLQAENMALGFLNLLRAAGSFFLFYVYLSLVLGCFPWTAGLSGKLLGYFWSPLAALGRAAAAYLPNLIFIVVVVLVVRYALKLVHLIFDGLRVGRIQVDGFHSDWADPTFQIVRLIVLALTAVILFPYLPGSDSVAFKGVTVFLGLLLSLGSGSAVSNSVAGVILTYMRPFQVGDRVMIGDTVGDVEEKNLLVTRIHTIKNEVVTIPNSMVLGNHMINYSSSAHREGLILHTAVTLGYDLPWRKAHELLTAAALGTKDILPEPKPYVLQTALGDYSVTYELNAHTRRPDRMAVIYSDLHQAIQDQFNQAGVEILSPQYASLRDGNRSTVPADHLPQGYQAPGFRMAPPPGGPKPGP